MKNDITNVIAVDALSFAGAGSSMRHMSARLHRASVNCAFAGYRAAGAGWQATANPGIATKNTAIATKNTVKPRPLGRCGPQGS